MPLLALCHPPLSSTLHWNGFFNSYLTCNLLCFVLPLVPWKQLGSWSPVSLQWFPEPSGQRNNAATCWGLSPPGPQPTNPLALCPEPASLRPPLLHSRVCPSPLAADSPCPHRRHVCHPVLGSCQASSRISSINSPGVCLAAEHIRGTRKWWPPLLLSPSRLSLVLTEETRSCSCWPSAAGSSLHARALPPMPHFTDGGRLFGQGLRLGEGQDLGLKLQGSTAIPLLTLLCRLGASRDWSVSSQLVEGPGRQDHVSSIRPGAPEGEQVFPPSDWVLQRAGSHLCYQTGSPLSQSHGSSIRLGLLRARPCLCQTMSEERQDCVQELLKAGPRLHQIGNF